MTASKHSDMDQILPSPASMQMAAAWRQKLYTDDASADDWSSFTQWLEEEPDHAEAYDVVCEDEAEFVRLIEASQSASPLETNTQSRWRPWMVAASLAVAVMSAAILAPRFMPAENDPITFATGPAELREFAALPGVTLSLNGESEMVQAAEGSREFTLVNGEAIFAIGPEAQEGIAVTIGDVRIIDNGTVFNVAKSDEAYRIAVSEGAVVISANEDVLITAGQIATYSVADGTLETSAIAPANVGAWREMRLEYSGAPIDRVLQDASRAVGANLVQGTCAPDADFSGSIQLSGEAEADAQQLAGLFGCTVRNDQGAWLFGE